MAELERRGHEAVAVDLPADDETAGLADYADTVVAAAGDSAPIVLVAQSMGGVHRSAGVRAAAGRAAGAAQRHRSAARGDRRRWWSATGQSGARDAYAERTGLSDDPEDLAAAFFHDVPADVIAAAQEQPFAQSEPAVRRPWPLSRWPDVPTRVVAGRDDRFFPADFQRQVAAERLGLEVDEIPGGHLVALSRPVELADRLEAYLGSR